MKNQQMTAKNKSQCADMAIKTNLNIEQWMCVKLINHSVEHTQQEAIQDYAMAWAGIWA